MLLGAVVERVTGQRLDAFARALVFEPLGMHRTGFGPIGSDDVAATEDCGWRGRLLVGEVHDENATVWDGVAGHAGLFGDAADLARYAAAWLRATPCSARPNCSTRRRAARRGDDGSVRGLGWLLAHPGRVRRCGRPWLRPHRLHRHLAVARPRRGHGLDPAHQPGAPPTATTPAASTSCAPRSTARHGRAGP
jgi:CubicO group peptidase (beta-lactamase class C family)